MEYAIGHILHQYAKNREIVIWGTGGVATHYVEMIKRYCSISFFVSKDHATKPFFLDKPVYAEDTLSPNKHYVIVLVGQQFTEIREKLVQLGFSSFEDYFDCMVSLDGLPIDVEYNGIFIGKKSYFPSNLYFFHNVASIGRFTSINSSVQIMSDHPTNMITTAPMLGILSEKNRKLYSQVSNEDKRQTGKHVKIGNDVWIGANVFINASKVAEIGNGAIIGTGAVVLEDVPPYAVVVGIPARVIRYRFTPKQIRILQQVRWWEWDDETIDKNAELLIYPERFFEKFGQE